jgi:recombination protein RecA
VTKKAILKPVEQRKKYFIALDSIGNLTCLQDVKAIDNDSATMGTRAKEIRNVFRSVITPMAQLEIPMVFTNHIMQDPGDNNPSKYDKETGGKGPEYMATVLVQFRSSFLYENPNGKGAARGDVIGTNLTARCTKNRFVPALTETNIELTFNDGVRKFSGLVEKALEAGLFQRSSSWLVLSCGKKIYRSSLEDEAEAEKAFAPIMDKLEAYIQSQSQYSSGAPTDFEISEDELSINTEQTAE